MARIRTSDQPPGPLADFFLALRQMHLRAGEPSTREIARLSDALSHDTVHRVLTSSSLPKWRNVEAISLALKGDVDRMRALWVAARVAEDGDPPAAAEPVSVTMPVKPARSGQGRAKILVVDDHPLFRYGLAQLLGEAGHEVLQAASGEESVQAAVEFEPDLVLMDINMPGMSGIDATILLRQARAGTRVVMLTMYGDTETVRRALRAGASGYLVKDAALEDLQVTIARALVGEMVFTSGLADAVLVEYEQVPAVDEVQLTAREREVLQLVANGLSNRGIASRLFLSPKTVANIVASVYAKLGVSDRASAAGLAVRRGLAGDVLERRAALVAELGILRKGRGFGGPGLSERVGPEIRRLAGVLGFDGPEVVLSKVRTWMLDVSGGLTAAHRSTLLAALGLNEDAAGSYVERVQRLAETLGMSARTVHRRIDNSIARFAEEALADRH